MLTRSSLFSHINYILRMTHETPYHPPSSYINIYQKITPLFILLFNSICRPAFQLRAPLIVWNCLLAIFSTAGALRTLPEFVFTFANHGLYHSVCVPRWELLSLSVSLWSNQTVSLLSFIERDRVSGFWTWMFVLSKVWMFGKFLQITGHCRCPSWETPSSLSSGNRNWYFCTGKV